MKITLDTRSDVQFNYDTKIQFSNENEMPVKIEFVGIVAQNLSYIFGCKAVKVNHQNF